MRDLSPSERVLDQRTYNRPNSQSRQQRHGEVDPGC